MHISSIFAWLKPVARLVVFIFFSTLCCVCMHSLPPWYTAILYILRWLDGAWGRGGGCCPSPDHRGPGWGGGQRGTGEMVKLYPEFIKNYHFEFSYTAHVASYVYTSYLALSFYCKTKL
jgi:hypothetical protein